MTQFAAAPLVLGVIAFYLVNSLLLLFGNELVFSKSGSVWRMARASRWTLRGKGIYLPNPLSPWIPLFRVAYFVEDHPANVGAADAAAALLKALRWSQVTVTCLLLLQTAGIAIAMHLGGAEGFLVPLGLVYLLIAADLIHVYLHRGPLQLSKPRFFSIAFDSLVCPPLAINLVRRISLNSAIAQDPVEFARAQFSAAEFNQVLDSIGADLDEKSETDTPEESGAIAIFRTKLEALRKS